MKTDTVPERDILNTALNVAREKLQDHAMLVNDLAPLLIGRLRLADKRFVKALALELRAFDIHREEWDKQP